MRRSRLLASAALAAVLAMSAPTAALAATPVTTTPNCFGKSAAQIAQGQFNGIENMGAHASGQSSPRRGIKNVARDNGFVHQSDMAAYLGMVFGEDIC